MRSALRAHSQRRCGTVYAPGEHEDDERDDDGEDESATSHTAVRVVHFSPDAPNVDVLVDEE